MMKVLRCRDLGGECEWEVRSANEFEIYQKASEHARTAHGITQIPKEMIIKAREAIQTVSKK